MYRDDYDAANAPHRNGDDVYSKPVKAGKRTYFFDVKATKGKDLYLTITESKRKAEGDGSFTYDKHKIFLYKEDFDKFREGLEEVISYIAARTQIPDNDEKASRSESRTGRFTDVDFEEL